MATELIIAPVAPDLPEEMVSAWTVVLIDVFEKQRKRKADRSEQTEPSTADGGETP